MTSLRLFLLKLSLFITPLVAVAWYLEYNLRSIPNTYNQKRKNFEHQLDSIEVLILGSSHALNAVNPNFLGAKAFNLANSSQTFFYDKALTMKYLEKMPKLKIVVIAVSYFSFFYQMEDIDERWRCYFYHYFWDIDSPGSQDFNLKKYSLTALYTPLTTLKFALKSFKVNEAANLVPNGFLKKDTLSFYGALNKESAFKRAQLLNAERREQRFMEIATELDGFVAQLRQKNIQVMFISTPTYKTLNQYLDKNIGQQNKSAINKLCEKYNARYYDFENDDRFRASDFANVDHLNERGATKFSQILNEATRLLMRSE